MENNSSKHNSSILSSKQKGFLVKCVIMLFIILGYLANLMPQYENAYNAALNDKVERLCSIDEPKIVIIGNSNVAFGINSEIIEQEMGMPVVNMGLHGALGNIFHDNMMDYNVHEGDIYIVAHSTYYNEGQIEDYIAAWGTVENHPKLWHLIKSNEYVPMIKSFPAYVKKCINYRNSLKNNEADGIYLRSSFNEYGDVAVYREYNGKVSEWDGFAPVTDESEFKALNEWNQYLKERGATMVVAGYPICNDVLPVGVEHMDQYQASLVEGLDCPVISEWRDYIYPTEYFYDMSYHLTTEGADVRTRQLVKDLKTWMGEEDN